MENLPEVEIIKGNLESNGKETLERKSAKNLQRISADTLANDESNHEVKKGLTPDFKVLFKSFCFGLFFFLIGYFHWSFLFVVLSIIGYTFHIQRKHRRSVKAKLTREIITDGEEKVIKRYLREVPSWVNFPDTEKAEWLNKIITSLWPHITKYVENMLRLHVEPMTREMLHAYKLHGFRFEKIHFGVVPPRLTGIKVYSLPEKNELILDMDIDYNGDADIGISLLKVHASVRDLEIEGKLRVVCKPLINDIPFIGGLQVFFLRAPKVEFDLGGVANLLDLPWLNGLLMSAINDQIANQIVLPNKMVFLLTDKISAEELKMPRPVGVLAIEVVEAKNLMQTDNMLNSIDPYVIIQQGVKEKRTKISKGRNPSWNQILEFPFEVPESEALQMVVMEKDTLTDDDFLGQSNLAIQPVVKQGHADTWIDLDGAKSGQVHLRLTWLPTSKQIADYQATEGLPYSRALLMLYLDSCQFSTSFSDKDDDKPSVKMILSTRNDADKQTAVVEYLNPVFQEGFTFLLQSLDDKLTFRATDESEEDTIASFEFEPETLLKEENMHISNRSFAFNDEMGTLTFSARLKFLRPNGKETEHGHNFVTKAGSSLRRVGGAAKDLGSATKSVGKHLGTSSLTALRSVSPSRVLMRSHEHLNHEPNTGQTKEGLLETDFNYLPNEVGEKPEKNNDQRDDGSLRRRWSDLRSFRKH